MYSKIRALSYYLPDQALTNEDLSLEFNGQTDARIFRKTGVRTRRISAPTQIGSDVAYECGEIFFTEHDISKSEIQFLILCTQGTDYKAPASACVLQHRLGLPNHIGALDFNLGCTGFIYGLSLAKGLVESGQVQNVLLITSEVATKVIHPKDLELRSIFGDGAAATLISRSETNDIGSFVFGTDGSGAEALIVNYSGSRQPMTHAWLNQHNEADGMKWGMMSMDGLEIFNFSMRVVPDVYRQLLDKFDCTADAIDLFVFHQANGFLLKTLRRKLEIPEDKFFVYLENCGNTVSSTIPIALKEAYNQNKISQGSKVMIIGFGIGLSWGGTIINL